MTDVLQVAITSAGQSLQADVYQSPGSGMHLTLGCNGAVADAGAICNGDVSLVGSVTSSWQKYQLGGD